MKNQLVNEKKELLTPYVDGSYIMAFCNKITVDINANTYIFGFLNGEAGLVRIKKMFLTFQTFDEDQKAARFLEVNKVTATDLSHGFSPKTISKQPKGPISMIQNSLVEVTDANGVLIVNESGQQSLIGSIQYRQNGSSPVTPFSITASTGLDFKDNLVLGSREGILIRHPDFGGEPLKIGGVISGQIEWDEIKYE